MGGPSRPRREPYRPTPLSGYGHGLGSSGHWGLQSRPPSRGKPGRAAPPRGGDESSTRRRHGLGPPLHAGTPGSSAGPGSCSAPFSPRRNRVFFFSPRKGGGKACAGRGGTAKGFRASPHSRHGNLGLGQGKVKALAGWGFGRDGGLFIAPTRFATGRPSS